MSHLRYSPKGEGLGMRLNVMTENVWTLAVNKTMSWHMLPQGGLQT